MCLGNGVTDPAQLDDYRAPSAPTARTQRPAGQAAAAALDRHAHHAVGRRIYRLAGCTDTVRQVKESYAPSADDAAHGNPGSGSDGAHAGMAVPVHRHPRGGPRGRGHCSINGQPFSDGTSFHALRLLGRGLRGGEGESGQSRGAAGLPAGRLDVDRRLADRRRRRAPATASAMCSAAPPRAARLYLLRHAAACAALQSAVNAERQAMGQRGAGPPGEPAAEAVAALIAGLGLPRHAARCRASGRTARSDRRGSRCTIAGYIPTRARSRARRRCARLLDAAW